MAGAKRAFAVVFVGVLALVGALVLVGYLRKPPGLAIKLGDEQFSIPLEQRGKDPRVVGTLQQLALAPLGQKDAPVEAFSSVVAGPLRVTESTAGSLGLVSKKQENLMNLQTRVPVGVSDVALRPRGAISQTSVPRQHIRATRSILSQFSPLQAFEVNAALDRPPHVRKKIVA